MSVTATTLGASINASETKLRVASATGFSVGKVVRIGSELMMITGVSGLLISVFRGWGGTKALVHGYGQGVNVGNPSDFPFTITPGLNINVSDIQDGMHHVTTFSFTNITFGATTNASLAMGYLLGTLPAGVILIKGSSMAVAIYGSGTADDSDTPDLGLGTTIGSGANALLSDVGAAAENIMTGQTVNDCSGTVEVESVNTNLAIEADGTKTVYLNIADGWAGVATITATGTVVLEWIEIG